MRNNLNALVVEDDPFFKPVVCKILYSIDERMNITWVDSAEEAKSLAKRNSYDIIIADYLLENQQNGLDLWRFCKKRMPGVPFVLMSGLEMAILAKLLRKNDSFPIFISKPFNPGDCQNLIQSLITIY